jgi:hypothetical protein
MVEAKPLKPEMVEAKPLKPEMVEAKPLKPEMVEAKPIHPAAERKQSKRQECMPACESTVK